MALATIRRITTEDIERLTAAAQGFVARHNVPVDVIADDPARPTLQEMELAIDYWADNQLQPATGYYKRLWLAAFRRAVREPHADTYAYGQIGYHVA